MSRVYRIKIPKCIDILVHDLDYSDVINLAKLINEKICVGYKKLFIHELTRENNQIIDKGLVYSS